GQQAELGRRGVDPRLVVAEERHLAARPWTARPVGGAGGQRGRAEGGGRSSPGQPLRPSTPGMRASFSDRPASSACMRVLSSAWRAVYGLKVPSGLAYSDTLLPTAAKPVVISEVRAASLAWRAGVSSSNSFLEPSTLASKAHRSVWEERSSSPVILPSETSPMRSAGPSAAAA